jgi:hypothetical protein
MRLIGAALLVLGILACVYGGFWYTKDETKAEIGPIKVKVEEKERVNVPLWAGVASIVAGALILTTSGKRIA